MGPDPAEHRPLGQGGARLLRPGAQELAQLQDQEDQQRHDHQCRRDISHDPPGLDGGHQRDLSLGAADFEEIVAAEGLGPDAPGAVLPGEIEAVVLRLPVRGQIAQGVGALPVVRETHPQMLRHRDGNGVVRVMLPENGAQLISDGLLPGGGEGADILTADRDLLEGDRVALLELPVHVEDGAAVLPHVFGAQHRLIQAVFRRHGGVKAQILKLCAVPHGVAPVPARHLGEDGAVKARAVGKGDLLDGLPVHHKAEDEGPALLGQVFDSGEGLKADGLSPAVDGEPVKTGKTGGDKVVILIVPVAAAGDGAGKLGRAEDLRQRIAGGYGACPLVLAAGAAAVADDAADIAPAAQAALGAGAFHAAIKKPRDTAGVIAVLQRNRAVGGAMGGKAHLHHARDAAGAFALGGDRAVIHAFGDHDGETDAPFAETAAAEVQLALGVKLVFDGETARNAAHVAVAVDAAAVFTARGLAEGQILLLTRLGAVHKNVLRLVHRRDDACGLQGGVGEGVEIFGDGLEIVPQNAGVAVHGLTDGGHLIGDVPDTVSDNIVQIHGALRIGDVKAADGIRHRGQIGGEIADAGGQIVGRVLGVHHGVADGIVERVDPVADAGQKILRGGLRQRLRLADDAAHVLAAVDIADVQAGVDIAAGAACDAAYVVAQVQVAHGAGVAAALDKAAGAARHAAGVGGNASAVGAKAADKIQKGAGVDALQAQGGVDALRVDEAAVFAAGESTRVLAGDAARLCQTADRAGGAAGDDDAAGVVFAGNAAYLGQSADHAAEAAAGEHAAVEAHKAAHHAVVPVGGDAAADVQVVDIRVLAGFQKEAARGLGGGELHIIDGVALPVKASVEGGDGIEGGAGEGEVVVQHDAPAGGPGVQGAVLCQSQQILRRADVNHRCLCRLLGKGGRAQGEEQTQEQQNHRPCGKALRHLRPPPFRRLRRRCPRPRPQAPLSAPGLCCPACPFCRRADAGPRPLRWCRGKRR